MASFVRKWFDGRKAKKEQAEKLRIAQLVKRIDESQSFFGLNVSAYDMQHEEVMKALTRLRNRLATERRAKGPLTSKATVQSTSRVFRRRSSDYNEDVVHVDIPTIVNHPRIPIESDAMVGMGGTFDGAGASGDWDSQNQTKVKESIYDRHEVDSEKLTSTECSVESIQSSQDTMADLRCDTSSSSSYSSDSSSSSSSDSSSSSSSDSSSSSSYD